jgi:hypothetical protein
VSFAAGWLTSELALHHVVWQALATLLFGWLGAFEHWPGRVGLLVTLGSWTALFATQLRAAATHRIFEDALASALGRDYRGQILPRLRQQLSDAVDWRRIALPFPIRSREVERIRNIRYARESGIDLHLDVYRSRAHPNGAPVTSRRCR